MAPVHDHRPQMSSEHFALHCNWVSLSGLSFYPRQPFHTSSHVLHPPELAPSTFIANGFKAHLLRKLKLLVRNFPPFWSLKNETRPPTPTHRLSAGAPSKGLLSLPPHGAIHLYRQMCSRISHLQKGPLDPKLPPATAPFLGLSSEPRLLKDLSTLAAFPSILCLPPT